MDRPPGRPVRLHRVILATGWVSLFTDLGSEMIYPVLPLFITVQLGAGKLAVGLIEGLAEGLPLMVRYLAGHLSDRIRNRVPIILGGYGVSSAAKPLIAWVSSVPAVLVLRVVDKIGKGFRGAPRDALVSDLADERTRGRAFGYTRAMDHLGAVGGGLLAFFLLSVLRWDVADIIKASALPGVLTLLTIAFFVREVPGRRASPPPPPAGQPGGPAAAASSADRWSYPRPFRIYVLCLFCFALAGSTDAFLLLRARELGFQDMHLPLLWAGLHVVKAVTSWWGGHLSDRWGRRRLLAVGWFLYSLVYAGLAIVAQPIGIILLLTLYGFFFGLTEGASRAVIADWVPPERRGRAFGWIGAVEGTGLVIASLVGGYLWDATHSATWTFAVGSFFSLAAAIGLTLAINRRRTKS